MGPQASERWATVIGIVADARLHENPLSPRQVTIYRPFAQGQPFSLQVVAKFARQENLSYRQLRSLLPGSGNNAWKVTFLNEQVNRFLATPRFTAALLTALAAQALGLAFVGVFGITALSVSVRTRDIVLRIALGADARRLAVGTFVSSMLPVLVGVCAGTAASYVLRGAYETLLNGTTGQSSALTAEASVAALLIAFTASLLPTRRALHLDPAQALRWE
jgi:ABC-type antimicrobial peptide transport system permease subunit